MLCAAGDLALGGPTPIGAQKANLSPEAEQYLQEVALNEQVKACGRINVLVVMPGHVQITLCPQLL